MEIFGCSLFGYHEIQIKVAINFNLVRYPQEFIHIIFTMAVDRKVKITITQVVYATFKLPTIYNHNYNQLQIITTMQQVKVNNYIHNFGNAL